MSTVVVYSRADEDGVLHLELPLGRGAAGEDLTVTVEQTKRAMTPEEWRKFVDDTAGKWQGELERPPQGEFETRDPL